MAKVGYSFWGFLGDKKYNKKYDEISTPDGNAFYSWSIIKGLLDIGYDVIQIMPDRDYPGYDLLYKKLFSSFCEKGRLDAYINTIPIVYYDNIDWFGLYEDVQNKIFSLFDDYKLNECKYILHEWRMSIHGRNIPRTCDIKDFQPDLVIQLALIKYCIKNNIKLIIFDLDYKISDYDYENLVKYSNIHFIELGYKYLITRERYYHCEIPFSFENINEFKLNTIIDNNLVYVGNRYERDWCIDKYIPTEINGVNVYGNWLEGGRDSQDRWPNIKFLYRANIEDFESIYSNTLATVLLAKRDYVDNGFMTARILEAIYFGCVPLFISEYGYEIIKKYAGEYNTLLTVSNKSDVIDRIYKFKYNVELRNSIITYLREHLRFMDVRNFIDLLEDIEG